MVDSITICATESTDRAGRGLCLVRSGSGGGWLAARWLCLPLSLDWTEIMGGGLIDLSTTGYHGAMNYSLLYHYSDSHSHHHWLPSHFSPSLILLQDLVQVQTFQHWHAHIWGNVVCYTVILLLSHDITCVHSTSAHTSNMPRYQVSCPTLSLKESDGCDPLSYQNTGSCDFSVRGQSRQCRQVAQVALVVVWAGDYNKYCGE